MKLYRAILSFRHLAVIGYASSQEFSRIKKIRLENPGCTINTTDIYDSQIGRNVAILDRTILMQVQIGNFSYVSSDSKLVNVEVGSFCSIGPQVQVGLAPHPVKVFVSTYPSFYSNDNAGCPLAFRKDKIFDDTVPKTIIGNDVWIGTNVIITGGLQIGNGAVIAAGSVVVKSVPPYAVVGGNPAKIIKYRFSDEQIESLLELGWWDWPIEKVLDHVNDFSNIEKLLKTEASRI